MRLPLSLLLCAPLAAAAIELRNELGEDQRSEILSVEIDGRAIGTLQVDRKRPAASLELPLDGGQHRYRLSGEAVMADGTRVVLAGAGLIVRTATMDRIGEATSAEAAIAAYEALLADLRAAAPGVPLDELRIQRGAVASEAELQAAEKRLGRALPKAYREFLLRVGSLRLGSARPPAGALYAPGEVKTLEEFVLAKARENEIADEQLGEMRRFIGKRFAAARNDLVLDHWEGEYPSVIRAAGRCAPGELPYAFPESQWEVLMGSELDDNPFVGIISYQDDIVGETQCLGFERQLAFSLHDHLVDAARDVLYLLADDEEAISIERGDFEQQRLWLRINEAGD